MNSPSCSELLSEIGHPPKNLSEQEDLNIWGLLFGAVFSLWQAEHTGAFPEPFSKELFDACAKGFNADHSQWIRERPVVPWLSGYFLNSARLRTVFGFENAVVKPNRPLPGYNKKLSIRKLLNRLIAQGKKNSSSQLFDLVSRVVKEFGGSDPDELPPVDLANSTIDGKAATPERAFYFLHLRVNKFKHDTSGIPLHSTMDEFHNDCLLHRSALSIAVKLWNEVRSPEGT